MQKGKVLVILAVVMLLFTTFVVSPAICEEELDQNTPGAFPLEDNPGEDVGICGGGDFPGPGGPQ